MDLPSQSRDCSFCLQAFDLIAFNGMESVYLSDAYAGRRSTACLVQNFSIVFRLTQPSAHVTLHASRLAEGAS